MGLNFVSIWVAPENLARTRGWAHQKLRTQCEMLALRSFSIRVSFWRRLLANRF